MSTYFRRAIKPVVNIQLRVEGQEDKVIVDGIDYSHSSYLLLRFLPHTVEVVAGTVHPDELLVELAEAEKNNEPD